MWIPSARRQCILVGAVLQEPGYERDGRRPQAWRDKLENIIAGDWVWEKGELAGVQPGQIMSSPVVLEQRTIYNAGKHRKASRSATRQYPGIGTTQGISIDDQFILSDSNEIPETRTVSHVPGKTTRLDVLPIQTVDAESLQAVHQARGVAGRQAIQLVGVDAGREGGRVEAIDRAAGPRRAEGAHHVAGAGAALQRHKY